jgi:transposase
MHPTKARKILHTLTQGFDPDTSKELPEDSIILRTGVFRALTTAIEVLNQSEARTKRREALPENVGMPWDADEERRLVAEFQSGETVDAIAPKHGRTIRAIEARLERLGLLTADQRTTNNSFTGSPSPKSRSE